MPMKNEWECNFKNKFDHMTEGLLFSVEGFKHDRDLGQHGFSLDLTLNRSVDLNKRRVTVSVCQI